MFKINLSKKWDQNNILLEKLSKEVLLNNYPNLIELSSDLSREISIDVITPKVADYIDKTIRFWNKIDRDSMTPELERIPIRIYINSVGGSYSAMMTIMDSIKLSRTPIYTIVTGTAQKEAFFIYVAGHKRYMYSRASLLFSKDLSLFADTDTQSGNYATFREKQDEELKNYLLERTKLNEGEYNKFSKNNWWIDSEEALRTRICNEILYNLD